MDRDWDAVFRHPGEGPDHLAALQVVTPRRGGAGYHNLRAAANLNHDGRGPARLLFPGLPPQFVSVSFIERHQERVAFVIPVDDQSVTVEGGRAAFAVLSTRAHDPEVLGPDDLSGPAHAVHAAGPEARVDVFAVGHRRTRRMAVGAVSTLVRHGFNEFLLPDHTAVAAVQGDKGELVDHFRSRRRAVVLGREITAGLARAIGLNRRGEVDPVLPHDRRRAAEAGDLDLPSDVHSRTLLRLLRPLRRWAPRRRAAGAEGAAPGRPVARVSDGSSCLDGVPTLWQCDRDAHEKEGRETPQAKSLHGGYPRGRAYPACV